MEITINALKFIGIFLILFVVVAIVVNVSNKLGERDRKQECYEIYATDNVILKKCEIFFERNDD